MDEKIVRLADEGNISALAQTLEEVKLEEVSVIISALVVVLAFVSTHALLFLTARGYFRGKGY